MHSCSIRRKIGEIWTDSTAFAVDQFLRRRLLEEIRRLEDLYVIFDDKLEHCLTRTYTTDARVFSTLIEVRKMRKVVPALSKLSAVKSIDRP